MHLTPVMEKYILHWGEMGARWGVNRSVAQIHALLYLAPSPMTAEDISETLTLARSNVSNSLKELQGYGLVLLIHQMGDRRDFFEAKKDHWDMLLTIVEARRQREIEPTLNMLRDCIAEAEGDKTTDPGIVARIQGMLTFLETVTDWYQQMRGLPRKTMLALLKLGARIARFVG
jgi:DNA-binding transcriptional regulator GbsR (MarR family)